MRLPYARFRFRFHRRRRRLLRRPARCRDGLEKRVAAAALQARPHQVSPLVQRLWDAATPKEEDDEEEEDAATRVRCHHGHEQPRFVLRQPYRTERVDGVGESERANAPPMNTGPDAVRSSGSLAAPSSVIPVVLLRRRRRRRRYGRRRRRRWRDYHIVVVDAEEGYFDAPIPHRAAHFSKGRIHRHE